VKSSKSGFEPPIYKGRDTPHFAHTFSNRTRFRACGRFWFVPFSEIGGQLTKKEDKRRIAVNL